MVKAGLQAIYLSGWQVAADANLAGRRTPIRASTRRTACRRSCGASTTRCCAPTSSTGRRAHGTDWLAPIVADAEAGFGGAAQRLRADEGDDRGGRGRRPFRGPARVGEEVRPPRRQGARPDPAVRPHAHRGAARRRRAGVPTVLVARTDALRAALLTSDVDELDAPFLPASGPPRASSASRAGSSRRSRARSPTRRTPTCSGSRRRRPTSARRGSSPRRSTSGIRASCSRTTARRRSTGARSRDDEIAGFRSSSASSATASSSSRSPASTRSTRPCSSSRSGYRDEA